MIEVGVGILGVGPRGLSILDRLIAFSRAGAVQVHLKIHLFDTRPFGVGCHDLNQPEHLLINTVSSQITQFSDESMTDGPTLFGPSFEEWVVLQGLGSSCKKGSADRSLTSSPEGYYPRAWLGAYLHWVFKYLVAHAPSHVTIEMHDSSPVDDIVPSDDQWELHCGSEKYCVDYVFLTTGHSRKTESPKEHKLADLVRTSKSINENARVIFDPYPIKPSLAGITEKQSVVVEGMGLTAFDVISELTIGRGGQYLRSQHGLVYHASGKEPKILLFSRSGLPLSARAINQKGVSGQYKAKFLTFARIEKMKQRTRGGKLDFEKQILPWLILDMQYAFYFSYLREVSSLSIALRFCNDFLICDSADGREALINCYVALKDQFSWENLVNPTPLEALENQSNFASWFNEYLKEDVNEALRGNMNSPLKAACDVLRDLRDILRYAIDFGGLTENSHRWLLNQFIPIMNRLAVGPPKERIEELLALMECGIVVANFGPHPHCDFSPGEGKFLVKASKFESHAEVADIFIRARIALPGPTDDESPLMRNLLRRGIVRPFINGQFHAGGIEINSDLNVIGGNGKPQSSLWALGTLVEGCKFYTFVLPRPYVNSTALVDAGRAVGKMVAMILSGSNYKQVA